MAVKTGVVLWQETFNRVPIWRTPLMHVAAGARGASGARLSGLGTCNSVAGGFIAPSASRVSPWFSLSFEGPLLPRNSK